MSEKILDHEKMNKIDRQALIQFYTVQRGTLLSALLDVEIFKVKKRDGFTGKIIIDGVPGTLDDWIRLKTDEVQTAKGYIKMIKYFMHALQEDKLDLMHKDIAEVKSKIILPGG